METVRQILEQDLSHIVCGEDIRQATERARAGNVLAARGTLTVALRQLLLDLYIYTEEETVRRWLDAMSDDGSCYGLLLDRAQANHQWHTCTLLDDTHNLCRALHEADHAQLRALCASSVTSVTSKKP